MADSSNERGYTDDQLARMSVEYKKFRDANGKAPSERVLRSAAGVSRGAVQAFLRDRRAIQLDETLPKDELVLAGSAVFDDLIAVIWNKSIEIAKENAQEKISVEIDDAIADMRDDVVSAESERDAANERATKAEAERDEAIAASNAVQAQAERVPELEKRVAELERVRENNEATLKFMRETCADIAATRVDSAQILSKFDEVLNRLDGEGADDEGEVAQDDE